MEGPSLSFAAIVGGIVVGAVFAAVDAGLSALGEVRLRAFADDQGPYAKLARRALTNMRIVQARLLAGRVLGLAIAAALAAVEASHHGPWYAVMAAAIVGIVYAVLAELLADLTDRGGDRWVMRALRWLEPLAWCMGPIAWPLVGLGRLVRRMVPRAPSPDPERLAELGIEHMIDEGEEEGAIDEDQAELLRSVLEFKNTLTREVMVPRQRMVAIDVTTSLPEVLATIIQCGHSRFPIYRETTDRILGVLYAKDLLSILRSGTSIGDRTLATLVRRPVLYVTERQKIEALFREMQVRRTHLAVVLDEFGGTSGIVTLEDIVEEIVGDIRDEYDKDDSSILDLGNGRLLVDASVSISDLEAHLGEHLPGREDNYDSLGGMVVELAGYVPTVGESVVAGAYRLKVRDSDERHVRRVEITRADRNLPSRRPNPA